MTTSHHLLPADTLRRLLHLRDLTDPAQGRHAVQLVVERIETALTAAAGVPLHRHRCGPVVPVEDNYDRLGYAPDAAARDARYSRYVRDDLMLRAHTSAAMPGLHERTAAGELHVGEPDLLLSVPGLVYRRDVVDRQHVGEPHQLDVWRLRRGGGPPLGEDDLVDQIATVVGAALPGRPWRTEARVHPYTTAGRQVDVRADDGSWIEIGECGLTHPAVLRRAGLDPAVTSGLAMGLGLDRLVMIAKGIDDIRLLRATDRRVASQLLDLGPYEPVSAMPAIRRDLSLAVAAELDDELLGDRVREALGDEARAVESIEVRARTPVSALPAAARARLGAAPPQVNVLVRVTLRDLDRTLTSDEANELRDRVHAALHEGTVHHWASRHPPRSAPRG
jgi:phenylalanyl-tRNA synthetase alpha chain